MLIQFTEDINKHTLGQGLARTEQLNQQQFRYNTLKSRMAYQRHLSKGRNGTRKLIRVDLKAVHSKVFSFEILVEKMLLYFTFQFDFE